MKLLCLVRFMPIGDKLHTAWEAVERFCNNLDSAQGHEIHREELQVMLVFFDPNAGLQYLSDIMDDGEQRAYAVSCGLAQGIESSATLASSLSGFTEGSLETLFEVAAAAGPQEVAISERLSSMINLAAPDFGGRFKKVVSPGSVKIKAPLVMGPIKRSGAFAPQ